MQVDTNPPQTAEQFARPIITQFLESPAVETALPVQKVSDDVREAMLAGRPTPMSSMALQVQQPCAIDSISSGVTNRLLQRVADQEVGALMKSQARIIAINEAKDATDPNPAEAIQEPITDFQPEPAPTPEPEAISWTNDTPTPTAEQVETLFEPAEPTALPREMGTMFSRWRRDRLVHASV